MQYYQFHGGSQDRTLQGGDIVNNSITAYSAGIVQGIDAAAMHVYLLYRHFEGDVVSGPDANAFKLDDLDVVMAGGIVRF